MGVPYVTEAVARAISSDVAEQKITSANIPEIEANPTLEGGESALTALEVNGTKYTVSGGSGGSEVVANPELEGDEDSLTGLEVDGVKYKVDSGSTPTGGSKVLFLGDLLKEDFSEEIDAETPVESVYLVFDGDNITTFCETLLNKHLPDLPSEYVDLRTEGQFGFISASFGDNLSDIHKMTFAYIQKTYEMGQLVSTGVDFMGESVNADSELIIEINPNSESGELSIYDAISRMLSLPISIVFIVDRIGAEPELSEPAYTSAVAGTDSEIIDLAKQYLKFTMTLQPQE